MEKAESSKSRTTHTNFKTALTKLVREFLRSRPKKSSKLKRLVIYPTLIKPIIPDSQRKKKSSHTASRRHRRAINPFYLHVLDKKKRKY